MKNVPIFDYATAPLERATSIEASAGTGKTYTIEHLVIRYLTEMGLKIGDILVVTFTEKATQEMRDRIRLLLHSLLDSNLAKSNNLHYERLTQALRHFNRSAIHTIHGFCRRTLKEFNFSSNLPLEMTHEENDWFIEECLWDLFREEKISPMEYRFLQRIFFLETQQQCIDFILKAYKSEINDVCYSVTKPIEMKAANIETSLKKLKEMILGEISLLPLLRKVQDLKKHLENLTADRLAEDFVLLNKASYKIAKREEYYQELKKLMQSSDYFSMLDLLRSGVSWKKFAFSNLKKKLLKKSSPGDLKHGALYVCLESILKDYEKEQRRLLGMGLALLDKCLNLLNEKISSYRAEHGKQTFQDQILDLEKTLRDYPSLATSLSRKYRVVLIDEFQDTDPRQWYIFKTAFLSKGVPVFLIGDPKQSIYKFRGANLNTYFKAIKDEGITGRGALIDNYRSHPLLIEGFNILFQKLFSDTDIPYSETRFPENKKIFSASSIPFELYFLNANAQKTSLSNIRQKNIDFIIEEIKAIEQKKSFHSLKDIAILTSKNEEAKTIREALNQEGIPAILSNQGNVWHSREAGEISILLKAVHNPTSIPQVMAIFFTSFFRLDNRQIQLIKEKYLFFFQKLLSDWKLYIDAKKIMKLKQELFHWSFVHDEISLPSYLENQLGKIGGERQVTNVTHLFELLSEFQINNDASLIELIAEIERQKSNAGEGEDNLIRLDMEKEAVHILTMHASKGLEFPIVFLHAGLSAESQRNQLNYFNYFDGDKKVFDFNKLLIANQGGRAGRNEIEGKKEEDLCKKNELYRLFYVAITRAKEKIYLPLCQKSGLRDAEKLPLMVFWKKVLGGQCPHEDTLFDHIPKNAVFAIRSLPSRPSATVQSNVVKPIVSSSLVLRPPKIPLWNSHVNKYPGMTSFTQLEKNLPEHEDVSNLGVVREESLTSEDDFEETNNVFNFAKGPRLGNLIHLILEKIPFEQIASLLTFESFCEDSTLSNLVSENIRHFFDSRWEKKHSDLVKQIIWQTLKAPISLPNKETFNLCQLSPVVRTHEVEFLFTVKKGMLNFPGFGEKLFVDRQGYLKGFIDFIFKWQNKYYLADWKTNALGPNATYYQGQYLEHAMERHHYKWQSLIYTLALCSQLACITDSLGETFSYKKHIGGVCYFFARGMSPQPEVTGQGIYFHHFDSNFLADLASTLLVNPLRGF